MTKGFTYKSYNFQDKDPIIDEIRTVVQASGWSHLRIQEESGVTAKTLRDWFQGQTRRPQAATLNAVARALRLVEFVAAGPAEGRSLSELASELGTSKSAALAKAR